MDHGKTATEYIRNNWFVRHTIKSHIKAEGFERIVFGEPGTNTYQITFVLSNNMIYVSGDVGAAIFELTESANLERIKKYDLYYFTSKLSCCSRDKYNFNDREARKQIDNYFKESLDLDNLDDMSEEDDDLYQQLINETYNWSTVDNFATGIYRIYHDTESIWFDSDAATSISDAGAELSYSIISYLVGLQIIAELLNKEVYVG